MSPCWVCDSSTAYALVSRPGALRASDAPTTRAGSLRGTNAGNAGNGSKWIRREKRIAIYARDGHRCIWCQADVADARSIAAGLRAGYPREEISQRLATLDHFLARSKGGTNRADNLLTCCMQCNHDRSHMSALEWAAKLAVGEGDGLRTTWGQRQERATILERALKALDRPIVKAPKA